MDELEKEMNTKFEDWMKNERLNDLHFRRLLPPGGERRLGEK